MNTHKDKKNEERIDRATFFERLATVAAAPLLIGGLSSCNSKKASPSRFKYDISKYENEATARAEYEKRSALKLDLAGLSSLSILNGQIAAVSDERVALTDAALKTPRYIENAHGIKSLCQRDGGYAAVNGKSLLFLDKSFKLVNERSISENASAQDIITHKGSFFISDVANKIIWRFSQDGRLINYMKGRRPDGKEGFIIPGPHFALSPGEGESIWASHSGRHKLQRYSFDGKLIEEWGAFGMKAEGFCGCCNPVDFEYVPGAGFFTSEKGVLRIKQYNAKGGFLRYISGKGPFSKGAKIIKLVVLREGELIAADCENAELVKLGRRV